jgi:hypothetical protein
VKIQGKECRKVINQSNCENASLCTVSKVRQDSKISISGYLHLDVMSASISKYDTFLILTPKQQL